MPLPATDLRSVLQGVNGAGHERHRAFHPQTHDVPFPKKSGRAKTNENNKEIGTYKGKTAAPGKISGICHGRTQSLYQGADGRTGPDPAAVIKEMKKKARPVLPAGERKGGDNAAAHADTVAGAKQTG